jgi:hypothetical protein
MNNANKTSYYTSISKSYGLGFNNLGETVLQQKLCFCTDPNIVKNFEASSQIKLPNGKIGVCFPQRTCGSCDFLEKNKCNF